ncbi:hypothetical protein VTJ49DRAFT_932 [Mycothermus thermophilus]|uniref:Uncharacterized protein n=1 Tax=Humicola insolens TaxID=85995 RepID=A0ABR3VDR3_HUMIN
MPQKRRRQTPGARSPPPKFKYFLALPPEIRTMIYDVVLWRPQGIRGPGVDKSIVRAYYRFFLERGRVAKLQLGLLRVNRQVAVEAAQRFYSINKFTFSGLAGKSLESMYEDSHIFDQGWSRMIQWFREIGRNSAYIRHIEYDFGFVYLSEMRQTLDNIASLQPLVPNLRRLILRYYPGNGRIAPCCSRLGYPRQVCETILGPVRNAMRDAGFKGLEDVEMVPDLPNRPTLAKDEVEHDHGEEGYIPVPYVDLDWDL